MPPSTKQALKNARAAIDRKDFDDAIAYSRDALRLDPHSYNAYVFIGIATAASGDFDRAHQAYNRAIALKPDNPLAYKGLIEALSKPAAEPRPLALADAHVSLAAHSAQFATQSLTNALDALSIADPCAQKFIPTVTDLVRVLDSRAATLNPARVRTITVRLIRLLAAGLPPDEVPVRLAALEAPPLSDLLARLTPTTAAAAASATPAPSALPLDVRDLVVARAKHLCATGRDVSSNLAALRALHAHDALLALAEYDALAAHFPTASRFTLAVRAVHLYPYLRSCSDAKSVLAARMLCAAPAHAPPSDPVLKLSGAALDLALKGPPSGREVAASPTQALVRALVHYRAGDFRLAVHASAAGRRNTAQHAPAARLRAHHSLGVVHAAALRESRKFKEATRVFEITREWARQQSDAWLDGAVARGLVATAVAGHGRRSRPASTAVEEAAAASASNNLFGLLECVWADALLGDDLDVDRMTELATIARARARDECSTAAGVWEYEVLDATFAWSHADLAALAAGRLAQMRLKAGGRADPATLADVQELHMEAAALVRTAPDPLAHLGYVFECLGAIAELAASAKMRTRAARCYEKALALDAAHPLAARQLSRLHLHNGRAKEGARVAARALERNPKLRWAHNFLGWHFFRRRDFAAASVEFQTALKGKPKQSAREEEILFGTAVGQLESDNDLVMDIDSWRGLALAYARQARTGPAHACLEDALSLLEKPPAWYRSVVDLDLAKIRASLGPLLRAEKCMVLFLGRMAAVAEESIVSVLADANAPLTVTFYHAEVLMQMAATQWLHSCYRHAVEMRGRAASVLEECVPRLAELQPDLNVAPLYKRIGDMWLEAASECPQELVPLTPEGFIEEALDKAQKAYLKALELADEKAPHVEDVAAVTLRKALYTNEHKLARQATASLLDGETGDAVTQCLSLLTLAKLSPSIDAKSSMRLANELVKSAALKKSQETTLNAAAAMLAPKMDDLRVCSEAAISAVRNDPTNWRGWLAVATVRETDAARNDWPRRMVRSCDDALNEADRLGGGPAIVQGRVRCLAHELKARRATASPHELYVDAAYCVALAGRAGIDEPGICREVIDEVVAACHEGARRVAADMKAAEPAMIYRHVHWYPHVTGVRDLLTT